MVTRDEVPHDRRLAGAIRVTVDKVQTKPGPRRDAELTVRDEMGDELTVIIWETHGISQSWEEGVTYELTGTRGKRYSTQRGTKIEVHSTKAFRAQRVSTNEVTRILALGDTHVGYRHRSRSKTSAWARNLNAREVFVRCLERAHELNIDAIVHAGDVFDHENTRGDRNAVGQAISRTVAAGIPFYYVFGNHDNTKGRKLLRSTSGTHLAATTSQIREQSVNLFGIDHSGQQFPENAPDVPTEALSQTTILVIHESPHPVIDNAGSLLYQNDLNKADISKFVESARFEIDLIVNGHLHVADQPRVQGHDIPLLVTGPTIPISKYEKDSNPSTWLLTVTESDIEVERQPV